MKKRACTCGICQPPKRPVIGRLSLKTNRKRALRNYEKHKSYETKGENRSRIVVLSGRWVYQKGFRKQKWEYTGTVRQILPEIFR